MGFHFLLQGIFLTQELNLCFPQCRQIPSHLSHQRSPKQLYLNVLCLNNVEKIQLWLMVTILCEQANVKPLWLSVFKLLLSGLWSPIMFHSTTTNFSHTDSTGPTWCPCFLLKDSLAPFREPPFTSYAILRQMISKCQAVRENWPPLHSLLPPLVDHEILEKAPCACHLDVPHIPSSHSLIECMRTLVLSLFLHQNSQQHSIIHAKKINQSTPTPTDLPFISSWLLFM